MPVHPVHRPFAALVLASALLVLSAPLASPGHAEVGRYPSSPVTSAFISEINTDWVKVSVNVYSVVVDGKTLTLVDLGTNEGASKLENTIHGSGELLKLANFGCTLYNRTAVGPLSQSGSKNINTYLFACAIE